MIASAQIGAWELKIEIMKDQRPEWPTDRPTDMNAHMEVSIPIRQHFMISDDHPAPPHYILIF